jgi:hypothetical protein
MLTTTGMLLIGGGAALLASLFEGTLASIRGSETLLIAGAAGALGLVRSPRRH